MRIVGVEPRTAATLTRALEAGHPVDVDIDPAGVAADSLAPRRIGELVFEVVRPTIFGGIVVSDDDIRAAQRYLWDNARIVAEPGGATAFAAVLSGAYAARDGERIVVLVTGGNTTAVQWAPSPNEKTPPRAAVR
jgi:threonine dehydratase